MSSLRTLPPSQRPRERLQIRGAAALSDRELVSLLLGSGSATHEIGRLAESVVERIDEARGEPNLSELLAIPGIGLAKGCVVLAALEFARRRIRPAGLKIRAPEDVMPLLAHWAGRKQEHFVCVSLSGAHEVLAVRCVTIGLVNSSQVHPREVFAEPIGDRAAAVIVAHNHPSGALDPSPQDCAVTTMLARAGAILGIPVLDHLIVNGHGGFTSLRERSASLFEAAAESSTILDSRRI